MLLELLLRWFWVELVYRIYVSVYHAVNNWFTGFMCQCNYRAVNTSKSCLHSFVETQRVYLLAEFGLRIVLQLYIQSISLQEFAIYMADVLIFLLWVVLIFTEVIYRGCLLVWFICDLWKWSESVSSSVQLKGSSWGVNVMQGISGTCNFYISSQSVILFGLRLWL